MSEWQRLAEADPAAASRLLQQLRGKLWVPHEGGQHAIVSSDARFRILRAGRRWGKTELAAHEIIMAAIRGEHQMVWWVSESDKNVRRGYRKVLQQLPRDLLAAPPPSESSNDRILRFKNGSTVEFYTAGSPDSLVGEGLDFLVVDEAALIDDNVWFQRLRPTLADKKGRALIISTPRGRNWFWKLWTRGQRGGDYASWHYTSYDNPTIDHAEIEDARKTMPRIIFEQEYLAEFLANAASWFTLPESAVLEGLVPPAGWVMCGLDLAKKEDFTVFSGSNMETRLPCVHERWNEIRWPTQLALIGEQIDELERLPAVEGVTVAVDSGGLGDVVFDDLEERGYDVVPINFGAGAQNRQKELMAKLLAANLETGASFIIEDQREEFESFEYRIAPSGRMQFEAATGHDDEVAAKMLEDWGAEHEAPPGVRVLTREPEPDPSEMPARAGDSQTVAPDSTAEIMSRPGAWG